MMTNKNNAIKIEALNKEYQTIDGGIFFKNREKKEREEFIKKYADRGYIVKISQCAY